MSVLLTAVGITICAMTVVCIWVIGSTSARREVTLAGGSLARQGICWRADALSPCHDGLIVSLAAAPETCYCAACGGRLAPLVRREMHREDFWIRFIEEAKKAGDVRAAEDISAEAHDAMRVLRDAIVDLAVAPDIEHRI